MKKFLAIVLALCMTFALAACGGDNNEVNDGSTPTDLNATPVPATPTPDPEPISELSINGANLIKGGQLTGFGYRGFTYADGTLTIDSVTVESSSSSAPLISFSGGDLEIVVVGDCSLTASEGRLVISGGEGDNLTITGDGTLTISATGAAAIDVSGEVNVSCALTVTGEPACTSDSAAAGDGYTLTVSEDSATLTVAANA